MEFHPVASLAAHVVGTSKAHVLEIGKSIRNHVEIPNTKLAQTPNI